MLICFNFDHCANDFFAISFVEFPLEEIIIFSFLYEEMDQKSHSILKLMIRENQITIQIYCFLLMFLSLKAPSSQNLSQIKQQMQTKIWNEFQNNFNRLLNMLLILGEKAKLMLSLIYDFKFEIGSCGLIFWICIVFTVFLRFIILYVLFENTKKLFVKLEKAF